MLQSLCKSLSEFVRDQDIFAVPVSLTYMGKSSHRTKIGGCVTILLAIAISISFAIQADQVFNNPIFYNLPSVNSYGDKSDIHMDHLLSTMDVAPIAYEHNQMVSKERVSMNFVVQF